MSYPTWGADKFNLPAAPREAPDSSLNAMVTPAVADANGQILHPGNPLLAFGVLALVAFGLMAASTTVRVGKTTAGVTIGKT